MGFRGEAHRPATGRQPPVVTSLQRQRVAPPTPRVTVGTPSALDQTWPTDRGLRIRHDKVDTSVSETLRYKGKPHHIGVGHPTIGPSVDYRNMPEHAGSFRCQRCPETCFRCLATSRQRARRNSNPNPLIPTALPIVQPVGSKGRAHIGRSVQPVRPGIAPSTELSGYSVAGSTSRRRDIIQATHLS